MKTDWDVAQERNREHLRQAVVGQCYTTERDSMFYQYYNPGVGKLSGEMLMVPQGTNTRPIRSTGDSILVRFTDKRKRHWFAWVHA